MFIRPADGAKVRDPETYRHLAAEGEEKPETSYWLRRLADGDVVIATPPAAVDEAQE